MILIQKIELTRTQTWIQNLNNLKSRIRAKSLRIQHRGEDGAPDNDEELASPEAGVSDAEVVPLHQEGERALIHVQHHLELVRHLHQEEA